LKQIHDYSKNWDFDLDGKADQVYFIGTRGAHLYFFLRIVLSIDNVERDFPFIQSDFPILPTDEELKKSEINLINSLTQFAVFDYDKDNIIDIFVRLDNSSFLSNKKILRKHGVKSNYIIITFRDREAKFRDYSNNSSALN